MMVLYFLTTLLHSFDWKLKEGEKMDVSEKFGIVLKKKTPLLPFRRRDLLTCLPISRLRDLATSKVEEFQLTTF